MPLKTCKKNDDVIAMAQSVQEEIEMKAEENLKISLGKELDINDNIFITVRAKALRFQRWYYWRHICSNTQTLIMVARLGLTFWEKEEQWCTNWQKLDTPEYISQ